MQTTTMGDIGQEFLTAQLKDELVFEGGGWSAMGLNRWQQALDIILQI
jgi:hypothetical protein